MTGYINKCRLFFVFRIVNYKEENWLDSSLISEKLCMFMLMHRCSKPNSLWYSVKENPCQKIPIKVLVQLGSMKIISKQCFLCNKLA